MSYTKFLIAALLLVTSAVTAQKSELEQAGDASYSVFAFDEAIGNYEACVTLSTEGKRRLAVAHARTGNYGQAERVYSSLVNQPDCQTEDLYQYAMILRSNNKYREAQSWMDRYAQRAGDSKRARSNKENSDLLDKLLKDHGNCRLTHLGLNTSGNEFAPVLLGEKLIFSATNTASTNEQFLNLYVLDSGSYHSTKRVAFKRKFNTKFHEGVAAFTGDGKRLFFTSSSQIKQGKNGEYNLGIYWSDRDENGRWNKPTAFPFNDPNYSLGQPSISPDGKTLYFSSNRPGGFGGVDLWKSTQDDAGNWTLPINLGPAVNTEGDELFPFIHSNEKQLFFSSNGHLGLGGLDVFVASVDKGIAGVPKNLGCPINSSTDDFSFTLSKDMNRGFLASNRYGGKGGDDIWAIEFLKPMDLSEDQAITGIVQRRSGVPVPEATVSVVDGSNTVLETVVTDLTGKYHFRVPKAEKYMLRIEADGFKAVEKPVVTEKASNFVELPLVLYASKTLEIVDTVYVTSPPAVNHVYTKAQPIVKVTENKEVLSDATSIIREEQQTSEKTALITEKSYQTSVTAEPAVKPVEVKKEVEPEKPAAEKVVVSEPAKPVITAPSIPAAGTVWESVYFAFNSSWIEADDRVQLNRIVAELNRNPKMTIELRSYTDCRADDAYNQMLSEKRLAHVIDYIRARIHNPYRVRGLAMGELPTESGCDCESVETTCGDEVLQKSRRVDVIVMKK